MDKSLTTKFNIKPIIKLENIEKSFGPVNALKGVNLNIFQGKVMAILGENGAGKSTLMNIISGVIQKSSGKIIFNEKEIIIKNIKKAEEYGIVIIHQEIIAVADMTVLDNMFLGHEIKNKFGLINYGEQKKLLKKVLLKMEMEIKPNTLMGDLSIAEQQMLEISKAILRKAKVIIMDEPTSSLSEKETNALFNIVRKLKSENIGLCYISHRLQEIPIICDFITIIRDGEYIGEYVVGELTEAEIISKMVGREITQQFPTKTKPVNCEKILEVKNLNSNLIRKISFVANKGEILGFSGLVGSKRTEVFKTIIGLYRKISGEIIWKNKAINFRGPNMAISEGMFYVTEDRKVEGLHLEESIRKNITLASLTKISDFGFINFKKEKLYSKLYFDKMRIKAPNIETIVGDMSGGNQQKVLIGKGFCSEPDLLIFDEPTRGVDVGARREIYDLIVEAKNSGKAVIIISSDLPEIVGLCDRVIVMKSGTVSQEIIDDITQENIMKYSI